MKPEQELQTNCLNCGASVKENYCQRCGQHVRDNTDRSIGSLLSDFLGNLFFLDNRFFISIGYLVRFPGRITNEFLAGKRKKFISPVTLFLFINLIYFFLSPLSDYSLSLEDQLYSQPYSSWAKEVAVQKLKEDGLKYVDYKITYQNASDNISKSIMFINVPLIAFFVFLMAFKRRRYYFDSLIFSFHYFTLFLASLVMLDFVNGLLDHILVDENSIIYSIFFRLFTAIIPLLYAMLSIKKFLYIKWYWSIPAGIGVMLSVFLANFLYRFVIFFSSIWAT